jgi:hypothetical protein
MQIDRDYFKNYDIKESELNEIRDNIFNIAIKIAKNIGFLFEYDTFDKYDSDSWFEIKNSVDGSKEIFCMYCNYYKYEDSQQDRCEFDLSYFWIDNYMEIENNKKKEAELKKKLEEENIKKQRKEKRLKDEYEEYLLLKKKFEGIR